MHQVLRAQHARASEQLACWEASRLTLLESEGPDAVEDVRFFRRELAFVAGHGGELGFPVCFQAAGHQTVVSLLSSRTRSDYDGYSLTPQHDVLTTTLNVLGINSRHALAPSLQLGVDLGATRERFDDPTGFTINGRNRVPWPPARMTAVRAPVSRAPPRSTA